MTSLFSCIESVWRVSPDRTILEIEGGGGCSGGDLDRRTAQYAGLFGELGLSHGDRVAVQVEKSVEALCLYLGCLRAGLVFLPMNPAYQLGEVDYLVENAEPKLLVCAPEGEGRMREVANRHRIPHLLTLDISGHGSVAEGADRQASQFETVECRAEDLACIVYTSGTTGRPKGAMITHGNLVSNARDLISLWEFTERDVLIHALPIFHVHGLFVACHCALLSGAKMLWHSKFDASAILDSLSRATVLMGVPTFYTRLLASDLLDRARTSGMRVFISGSAPLLEETFREFQRRTGHSILERYGMTETGMNTSNPLNGERRPGTVGFALPSVSVRVTDEGDLPLPVGEVGMIQVKGPNVFAGYWKRLEQRTQDFTADDWFRTGDLGKRDSDGYFHIVGRAKDLIITGGYNVYPKEVELVLDCLEGVAESAVVGVPHPDFGEAVVAVIRRDRSASEVSEAEIIVQVRKRIASYKAPKRILFVEELPRNTMGKVQKNVLREWCGKVWNS